MLVAIKAAGTLIHGRTPGQLVIQYTDWCNARCPQCGMRATEPYARSRLDPPTVRRILETAAKQGFMSVSITGGEPFLFEDEILPLLRYARELGIRYTRSGTNGFMFRGGTPSTTSVGQVARIGRFADKLREAELFTFWISLDSADPMVHERTRGLPGVVDGIRRALPILHEHGVFPSANLGINRLMGGTPIGPLRSRGQFARETASAFDDFFQAVIDLGFTTVNVCYPMSLDRDVLVPTYKAISAEQLVAFNAEERAVLFEVLAATVRRYRSRIRIFSPLVSLRSLAAQHGGSPQTGAACRGGVDFLYVSAADGVLYPCGYRGGEPLGHAATTADWRVGEGPSCRLCDWECFRDPSELFAPLVHSACNPFRLIGWARSDPSKARDWLTDLRYYRACDYFSLGRPPRIARLRRFAVSDPYPG